MSLIGPAYSESLDGHAVLVADLGTKETPMSMRRMPVLRLPEDCTGSILRVTYKDGSSVIDLSVATGSIYFHAKDENGTAVTTDGTASFFTDGTDGIVQHTLVSGEVGTVRRIFCEYEVQGYNGGNLISEMFVLDVIDRAKV